jgi:hypothetical protein
MCNHIQYNGKYHGKKIIWKPDKILINKLHEGCRRESNLFIFNYKKNTGINYEASIKMLHVDQFSNKASNMLPHIRDDS